MCFSVLVNFENGGKSSFRFSGSCADDVFSYVSKNILRGVPGICSVCIETAVEKVAYK